MRRLADWLHILVPGTLLLIGAGLRVADPERVALLRHHVFDAYNRLKPRTYEEAPVRIVDIDDESLSRLGQWPWPRTVVAQVLERLQQLGAAVTAFDIVFAEPDRTSPRQVLPLWTGQTDPNRWPASLRKYRDHDETLAQTISQGNVVAGAALSGKSNDKTPKVKMTFGVSGDPPLPYLFSFKGAAINLRDLEEAAKGVGSFNTIPEPDGTVRRVPLIFRIGDKMIPSLAAEALRVVQGASVIFVKSSGASGERSFGAKTGISSVKIGQFVVPTDAHGRVWLYFTEDAPQRTIPVWELFEKGFDPDRLAGCIIFLGTSAAGLMDQRHTPLKPLAPGVEIHAQLTEQVLLGRFLRRPDWADGAEIFFLILFGSLLILLLKRLGAAGGAAVAFLAGAGAFGFSWLAFTRWQWLIDPVYPAAVVLLVYISSSLISFLRTEKEKREVRGAFSRYMSPVLVEKLAEHPELLRLGGEKRVMTFHFCDVAHFTTISQGRDPEGVTRLLNRFLTPMTDIILKHKGSIDKYVGDCIVAYWNAPLDDPDHAKNACLAVLEMHAILEKFNSELRVHAEREGERFMEIRIRTGLNTGACIVGNMGSNQRFDYSILGDDVNVASRLEGANKFFGTCIMVGESTFEGAKDAVEARELGRIKVVGKDDPVRVFELLSVKGSLPEGWKKVLPAYEDALRRYQGKDFEGALKGFDEVLAALPEDGPSKLYRKICEDYAVIPPPDDWDMVFKLTEK